MAVTSDNSRKAGHQDQVLLKGSPYHGSPEIASAQLKNGHWAFGSKKLVARLLSPKVSLWRYSLEAWPIALIPSVLLFVLASGLLALAGVSLESIAPPAREVSVSTFLGAVIFAPIVETLVLIGGIKILGCISSRPVVVAMMSALVWGILHGIFGALWFFGAVWSFFVFSCAYLAWRDRSFKAGFIAASVPHALVNLTAMSILLFKPV